jgi:hypothetical protein
MQSDTYDSTQDRQDDAVRAERVAAHQQEKDQMKQIDYSIHRVVVARGEALTQYIKACESLARSLTEAAAKAVAGHYVSATVMSNSLVQDIPEYAIQYRMLGETLTNLRMLKESLTVTD